MKAKYIRTEYVKDRYKPIKYQVFEYRGKEYVIPYDKYGNYIGSYHSVKGEHSFNQINIDERLDYKPNAIEDAQKGFELFWEYCEKN